MLRNTRIGLAVPLLLTVAVSGCGRPQVKPENLQLIAALRTAISARNTQWLEQNAEMIAERYRDGKMSESEFEQFQAIVEKARGGDWRDAEEEALAFQKAQRPSDEQYDQASRFWDSSR